MLLSLRQVCIQRVYILHFRVVLIFNFYIDVRRTTEFCFRQITYHYDEENIYLGVFFRPWLSKKQALNVRSKYRIIHRFFDINLPHSIDDPQESTEEPNKEEEVTTNTDSSMPSVSELYSMLRDAHAKDKQETVQHALLPTYFIPELRSYQSKALHWMLNRERLTRDSDAEFFPTRCHSIPNKLFYFNYRTAELMDHDPGCLKIPSGGILAGEIFQIIFRVVSELQFHLMLR